MTENILSISISNIYNYIYIDMAIDTELFKVNHCNIQQYVQVIGCVIFLHHDRTEAEWARANWCKPRVGTNGTDGVPRLETGV